MPSWFVWIVENVKMLGSTITAIGVIAGGYVYLEGPIPAMRHWVVAQFVSENKPIKEELSSVKSRVIDIQLQQNTARRDQLRSSRYRVEQDLKKDPSDEKAARARDEIADSLDDVERERGQLLKEKDGR